MYPRDLTWDINGVIWVSIGWGWSGSLWRLENGEWSLVPQYLADVISLETAPAGGIWVGTPEHLELFHGGKREILFIDNLLPINNELHTIKISPRGDLWCGGWFGEFAALSRGTWMPFNGEDLTRHYIGPPSL